MTSKLKAVRYNIRRVERRSAAPAADPDAGLFDNQEDGFGALDFKQPEPQLAPETPAQAEPVSAPDSQAAAASPGPDPEQAARPGPTGAEDEAIAAANAAIAAEGLTGRHIRRARLIAQRHNITATSDFDAIRQLRDAGIDPFSRASILGIVDSAQAANSAPATAAPQEVNPDMPKPLQERAPQPAAEPRTEGTAIVRLPGDSVQLPQKTKPINPPSVEKRAEVNQAAEIQRMQQDLARRRRRRLALLAARLFAFVMMPTFLAGWYYYMMATPMYSTRSEFVIQQAGPSGGGGTMGGLFSGTSLATSQDSIAVQGYLQSREAMSRLETDVGFRRHFQGPEIDALQRLAGDASLEAAYKKYKNFVKISYDSTEGVVRMDVAAADPAVAADWSRQLITYAEEQVDHMTQRLREDQMRDAQEGYEKAQTALSESQRKLIELQEKFKILSSEAEIGLLTSQINTLETQLTQERLSLAEMEANPEPNQARMEPIKRRIATLEAEVIDLRKRMTEGSGSEVSLAKIQGELLVAQADLQTRQLLLAQALQSMETARVEANRQVRYLSLSVSPVPPDEPTFPRAFENTLVTMLIMLGIYLMISMTASILREQVSA